MNLMPCRKDWDIKCSIGDAENRKYYVCAEIEDTKVFIVVKLRPKSILRERRKHVKCFFFPCGGRREGPLR